MSKTARQAKIRELIKNNNVNNQESLVKLLNDCGFEATQATVSRDIKDLELVKTSYTDENGNKFFRYVYYDKNNSVDILNDGKRLAILKEMMISAEAVNNFIVVKSESGMANSVAAYLDDFPFNDKLGTIAGDDTVLIIMRSTDSAKALESQLKELL